jgi:hypothetical protein
MKNLIFPRTLVNLTKILIVVFEYFYDIYLFEIKHVSKLNWTKRPSEVLSFSVRRVLSITFRYGLPAKKCDA